ncbi:hypothetical protein [Comamonas aquatica]|uniref:hypothetical protein n=1 Tax=Comamonas aquatica TaxID=225991 RepID=UPI00391C5935
MLAPNTPRPTRMLMALLPRLLVNDQGQPDFDASDAMALVQIAEAAELLQRVLQLGISAIGQLLAHASVQVETGELAQDTVEALGWLLAELGDAAAACVELAAPCRHATADFTGARYG